MGAGDSCYSFAQLGKKFLIFVTNKTLLSFSLNQTEMEDLDYSVTGTFLYEFSIAIMQDRFRLKGNVLKCLARIICTVTTPRAFKAGLEYPGVTYPSLYQFRCYAFMKCYCFF